MSGDRRKGKDYKGPWKPSREFKNKTNQLMAKEIVC